MTNDELIAKYNPKNARNLTEDDLVAMRTLTDEQIDVLAAAYPNDPSGPGRAYLLLWDDRVPANKQLYAPSTWQNLRNVRKYSNQKSLHPYTFLVLYQGGKASPAPAGKKAPVRKQQQVDLSAADAAKELQDAINTKTKTATGGIQRKAESTPITGADAQKKVPPPAAPKKGQDLKAVPPAKKASSPKGPAKEVDPSEDFTDGTEEEQ